jgi:predicted nucleic acid-binding protein
MALRVPGLLVTRSFDTDALVDAFALAGERISATDASCVAFAGRLRLPLVTDDRKQRRVASELFPGIELISTLDLLHDAAQALGWSDDEIASVAADLRWRGNFAPPRQDPRSNWYAALLQRADVDD